MGAGLHTNCVSMGAGLHTNCVSNVSMGAGHHTSCVSMGTGHLCNVNIITLATLSHTPIRPSLTHTHSRTGFAKVAGLTGVPLIPVYTANIRLAYRAVCLGSLLEVTRLPLVGIYRKYNI